MVAQRNSGQSPIQIINQYLPLTDQDGLNRFTQTATTELQTLAERAQEVGGHAQNVLGSAIQRSDDGTLENPLENAIQPATNQVPIHERALEYGRYLYCQEVVKEYELKTKQVE
jgi:hypothetical protein